MKKKLLFVTIILTLLAGVLYYISVADFMSCHQTALMSCL